MSEVLKGQLRWVCAHDHIGAFGPKRHPGGDPVRPCHVCGEPAHLRPTSVSGKRRRSHSLAKFQHREEHDSEGPVVTLEPLPPEFELSDDQLAQLAAGAHPEIRLPKTATIAPLASGHLYEAGPVDLFITAVRDAAGELIVDYVEHRSEQEVREDAAYFERGATRQGTLVNLRTGEEIRGAPEAERLSKGEVNDLTREKYERELVGHKEAHAKAAALLKELEKDYSRNELWGYVQSLNKLGSRVEATETRIKELSRRRPKGR